MNLTDSEHWQKMAHNVLRMLHKLKGHDLAFCLRVFDKDMLDKEGESIAFKKCPDEFFERIVAILPIHVKKFRREDLVSTVEVLVKRNLGSERLFYDFLCFQLERKMLRFTVNQYCRIMIAMADKQYYEDPIFWTDYMWTYLRKKSELEELTAQDARKIWDCISYLKLKCPSLDTVEPQTIVEALMK